MSAAGPVGRVLRIARGELAGTGADGGAQIVTAWQAAIRRVLLIAHLLPAVFGLIAVSALERSQDVFPLAVGVWLLVLAWSTFLAVAGWNRSPDRRILTRWVLADAAVMAILMFIGTPARPIVSYIAVDGALFAAAFVSTRLALTQVAIVYGALWAASAARDAGSEIPSPIIGWLTPLVITLAGVLALSFIRTALDELGVALEGRRRALAEERRTRARAAREEALVRDLATLEEELEPEIARLSSLAGAYQGAVEDLPARTAESRWIVQCVGVAAGELAALRELVADPEQASLGEVVETAVLRAGGVLLADEEIRADIAPELAGLPFPEELARALGGFVREAVNNAVIHGGRPVRVFVAPAGEDEILVAVEDGGGGFDPGQVVAGIGLEALAGNARALGGRIEQAVSGGGHTVSLRFGAPA